MRLFKVVDKNIRFKQAKGTSFYDNKTTAKTARNDLNKNVSGNDRYVVARGPDHWRGESFGTNPKNM